MCPGRYVLGLSVCWELVALLCVHVDVRVSSWLDSVLQYSRCAIHVWVCRLLLLLLLDLIWGYLLHAILGSICLLVSISRSSIRLSRRVSRSVVSLVNVLPRLVISLVLEGSMTVFIGFLGCSIGAVQVGFLVWSVIWLREIRVAGTPGCT